MLRWFLWRLVSQVVQGRSGDLLVVSPWLSVADRVQRSVVLGQASFVFFMESTKPRTIPEVLLAARCCFPFAWRGCGLSIDGRPRWLVVRLVLPSLPAKLRRFSVVADPMCLGRVLHSETNGVTSLHFQRSCGDICCGGFDVAGS